MFFGGKDGGWVVGASGWKEFGETNHAGRSELWRRVELGGWTLNTGGSFSVLLLGETLEGQILDLCGGVGMQHLWGDVQNIRVSENFG